MRNSYVLAAALALAVAAFPAWGAGTVETKVTDLGVVPGGVVSFANPESLLVASPDGTRLAWAASEKKPRKWRVVESGKPGPAFDEVDTSTLAFTPDGKRLAYVARLGAERHLLIADKVIRNALAYAFSPDGKRLAYVTCDANDNHELMLNDAKVATRAHPITQLTFSPDSRRFAYVFRNSRVEGRYLWLRPQLVVDGKPGKAPHQSLRDVTFSPDSRHWAAAVQDDERWRIVMDDKELPACDEVGAPAFAPAGLHLAYPARAGVAWHMVRDSKAGPKCDKVGLPVFSPDGAHLAHFARRAAAAAVVCDEREAGNYSTVEWIGFSPDGRHLAWVATRGGDTFMVVDGAEGPPHAQVVVPRLSRDVPGKLRYVAVDADPKAETRTASLVEIDWPANGTWEDAFPAPAAR